MTLRDRLGLSAYYFFSFAAVALVAPFVPLYLRSLGLTYTQIGTFGMASALCGAAMQVPVGSLSDHLRRRRPFVILGALALGSIYVFFPEIRSYCAFIALYGLAGILAYSSSAIAGALAVDLAQSGRTGTIFAGIRIWGSLSFVLMLAVTTIAPGLLAVRLIFPLIASLYALSGLSVLLVREKGISGPVKARLGGAGRLLKHPDLMLFLVVYFLYMACLMGGTGNLSLYLNEMGAGKRFISLAFITSAGIEIPFMLKAGAFADRYGRRPLLVVASLVLPFRLFCYFLIHTPWLVLTLQLMHGLTFSIITVISMAYVTDIVPPQLRATGQGLLSLTLALSAAVGPVLAGWVGDRAGLHALYAVLGGIASVSCLLVLLFLRESLPEPPLLTSHNRGWARLMAVPWLRKSAMAGAEEGNCRGR
ncbi:MAG: MFS transporter [Armatimonadetes bacterium]|nr:MFS transporter [Armatimonadota bacterium]